MANQTGKNLQVGFKVEATLNTAPGTDGEELRFNASPGLKLNKTPIRSGEIRSDALSRIARHGSRSVSGSFSGEMAESAHDTLYEAAMRCSSVASFDVTNATSSLGALSFASNAVYATTTGAGSWAAAGVRVGDVFRMSGLSGDAAVNDDINAQVVAMTTHTLTLPDNTYTAASTAVSTWTASVGKKFSNPATAVSRSFYFGQYDKDIDLTTAFGGVRVTGFNVTGNPDGMAEVEFTMLGMSATPLATGASPYFTTLTSYTTDPLVFADAAITLGGTTITKATAFNLAYEITGATVPVIGSEITPDVFLNDARLSGSITILREDLANLQSFIDEDELELTILLEEPGTAPQPYISIFVPLLKFMDNDSPLGSDGARTDTIPWEAGVKASATGYDQTLLTICTSAS